MEYFDQDVLYNLLHFQLNPLNINIVDNPRFEKSSKYRHRNTYPISSYITTSYLDGNLISTWTYATSIT